MSPGSNVIPPTSITSPAAATLCSSIDAIRFPSSTTSCMPGNSSRPSKIRAFVNTTIGIPLLGGPAALAQAPLGREALVVVADPVGHPAIERLAVELVGHRVGLQLTADRLEHAGDD